MRAAHTRPRRRRSRFPAANSFARAVLAAPSRERVNSPQRPRKARKLRGASTANRGMRAAHTRPRRRTSRFPSREFIRRGGVGGTAPGASKLAATTAESPANCAGLQRRTAACAPHPSAKADITFSQPRIHSPGPVRGTAHLSVCHPAGAADDPDHPTRRSHPPIPAGHPPRSAVSRGWQIVRSPDSIRIHDPAPPHPSAPPEPRWSPCAESSPPAC
jgi:hypothetical protein